MALFSGEVVMHHSPRLYWDGMHASQDRAAEVEPVDQVQASL
jgi:hypothetical protein